MYLKENKLVIRDATIDDAPILLKWWNDGKVMEHAGFPNGLGTSESEIVKQIEQNTMDHKRLILECSSKPIGEMSYRKIDEERVEIGIKICEVTEQEKGYGTYFLNMLLLYLFIDLGFNKIILDTNIKNYRAQHVYERIGFKKVKVNINSWTDQLGVLQSSIDYELTRNEYFYNV